MKNKYIKFYKLTKETLDKLAEANKIPYNELTKYFVTSDKHLNFYNDPLLSEIGKVFAQMILHAQNGTLISSIVKFEENYDFLQEITSNFEPNSFLEKYGNKDIENLVEDLRWTPDKNKGLKWSNKKSKTNSKDKIVSRFANTMLECANFLSNLKNKQEVINKLTANSNCPHAIIQNFRNHMKTGFGIALTCDFLKEFDEHFNFLAKPDIHIIDVMTKLKQRAKNYYGSDKRKIELLEEIKEMVDYINSNLPNNEKITVYQLDRMIWLVCTQNFFLHKEPISQKQKYLKSLENL